MSTRSAGIALYRRTGDGGVEVLLGRFGGPYWTNRERAWGIPKGEYDPEDESAEAAARREFVEETGFDAPTGLIPLGSFPVGSEKTIDAFAAEGDADPGALASDTFTIEWPPNSGERRDFPEIAAAAWVPLDEARERVVKSQVPLIERLTEVLAS